MTAAKPYPADPGRLPKNQGVCPTCGSRVLLRHVGRHERKVYCLLARTFRAMAARGWARAGGHVTVLLRAGLQAERAPLRVGRSYLHAAPEPWRGWYVQANGGRAYGANTLVDVPEDGWWAAKEHVAAAKLLSRLKVTAPQRRAYLLRLVADPAERRVAETLLALAGPGALAAHVRASLGKLTQACPSGGDDRPWAGDGEEA